MSPTVLAAHSSPMEFQWRLQMKALIMLLLLLLLLMSMYYQQMRFDRTIT